MPVEEEIAIIFCGVNGLLANVPVEKVADFEKQFLQLLHAKYADDVLALLAQGKMTDEVSDKLKTAAQEVGARF